MKTTKYKVGDTVKIIAGRYKGHICTITEIEYDEDEDYYMYSCQAEYWDCAIILSDEYIVPVRIDFL